MYRRSQGLQLNAQDRESLHYASISMLSFSYQSPTLFIVDIYSPQLHYASITIVCMNLNPVRIISVGWPRITFVMSELYHNAIWLLEAYQRPTRTESILFALLTLLWPET